MCRLHHVVWIHSLFHLLRQIGEHHPTPHPHTHFNSRNERHIKVGSITSMIAVAVAILPYGSCDILMHINIAHFKFSYLAAWWIQKTIYQRIYYKNHFIKKCIDCLNEIWDCLSTSEIISFTVSWITHLMLPSIVMTILRNLYLKLGIIATSGHYIQWLSTVKGNAPCDYLL